MLRLRIGGTLCALILALAATGAATFAQERPPFQQRFDLTSNGVVDGADVALAAAAWADAGGSCALTPAGLDLNGDGCLDAADVQLVAAAAGSAEPGTPVDTAPAQATARTWTVNGTSLDADAAPGDGACADGRGRCTLRAAIQEANRSVGPDLIRFDVRDSGGACPSLVTIAAPFEDGYQELVVDDPRGDGTTIDGYTQCGASANTGAVAGNAVIKVELKGNYRRDIHGLHILSPNNVVRGLSLYNWDRQIELFGERSRFNRVEGNIIGTNAAQTFVSGDKSTHHTEGLRIQIGASYNVVGCGSFAADGSFQPCRDEAAAAAARNIVAGNGNDGIHLERQVFHNRIVGNYIGVKQDGATVLANGADGVDIEQGPQHNWLGGPTPYERNVISGNDSDGIEISHGSWTQFNSVVGNYFGLDATGTKAVPNEDNGISFEDTVDQNEAYGNVVSGNLQSGFRFYVLATRNLVRNNVVGLAADGRTAMPNRHNGVYVMGGSQHNRIVENVIAYNRDHGVFLSSTSDSDHNGIGKTYYNTISRNRIFSNDERGISIYGKRDIYPNEGLAAPVIEQANARRVAGRACAGCRVEVFLADKSALTSGGSDESGEGAEFVGEGTVGPDGRFNFAIGPVALGQILTATVTDGAGNTSVFARNVAARDVAIEEATPVPTATNTPTVEPTITATPEPTTTPATSPTPTSTREPAGAPQQRVWLPLVRR
jgi:hypothetical protein